MGVLPTSDSLQRPVLPDTPPELASPTATTFSSRSSPATEQAWSHRAPASLPMYGYDKNSAADMSSRASNPDSTQPRTEAAGQTTSRQQLPSLSSLFGPPSARPLHSPMSDRPSSYAQSPLDRPRLSSSGPQSGSYFPSASSPSMTQPRSTYDVKFEPLARSFSGSGSPRHRDVNLNGPDSRSEAETSSKWSSHQENGGREYSLTPHDSSYRSPGDRFRHNFSASKESNSDYEQRTPQGQNHSPTAGVTVPTDIVLSKDGLGPKIWTGTHFLPRFVRAAEVPGEGLCYFYDDGTHCKTVIDGEAVNAHWGVTKAGKPRKRLAIACVTCREKKIKCDPDYPRCIQCDKFNRVCKFKNAPRGGNNTSPSTPPAELDDSRKLGAPRYHASEGGSPVSPRDNLPQPSPGYEYNKRVKMGPDSYAPTGNHHEPHVLNHSKTYAPEMNWIPEEQLSRAWRTDPSTSDHHSINAVVAQFFANVDSTMILKFLPETVFKNWVSNSSHSKSPEDLMLLYSMLAVGMVISGGSKTIAHEYAQVAHYAQKMSGVNGLQMAQSRVLLAVYYVAAGRLFEASELISSAAAVAASMQLGVEFDRSREAGMSVFPLGLNRAGYCEARRRTLWSIFMMERLNGMFPDRPAMICAEDIYIRLPADSQNFERQIETHMPFFDPNGGNYSKLSDQRFETAGFLVEMMHLWSTSQAAIYRLVRRRSFSETEVRRVYDYGKQLHALQAALPSRLSFNGANLESAAFNGNGGSFLTMHLLYHHAMIKLSRHAHLASRLSTDVRQTYLQQCYDHATHILRIVGELNNLLHARPAILSTTPPALCGAVIEALDVLTASGSATYLNNLIDDLQLARSAIDGMIATWVDTREGKMALEQRLQILLRIRDHGSRPTTPIDGCRVFRSQEKGTDGPLRWQISEAIEKLYPRDMDIVYFATA